MERLTEQDYLEDYNHLLSKAFEEKRDHFSALASPTLCKQETVTFLYLKVIDFLNKNTEGNIKKISFQEGWKFFLRIFYTLINLLHISFFYRVTEIPQSSIFIRTWLIPKSFEKNYLRDVIQFEAIKSKINEDPFDNLIKKNQNL